MELTATTFLIAFAGVFLICFMKGIFGGRLDRDGGVPVRSPRRRVGRFSASLQAGPASDLSSRYGLLVITALNCCGTACTAI
jgi:hypothetical protein